MVVGLISRHNRPVYWSPSSRTALAEAELEYDDSHECTAAFTKMPFVRLSKVLESNPAIRPQALSALIWTTTPWTLPANKAIAVRADIEYIVIELLSPRGERETNDQLLMARDRVGHVISYLPEGTDFKIVVDSLFGSEVADGVASCSNIFQDAVSPVVCADFVTASSGTGLVHMAPGHGMEDYQVCQQLGIGPAFAPVDDTGNYTPDVSTQEALVQKLSGLDVQTDGVDAVLAVLRAPSQYLPQGRQDVLLLASHSFTHKNPIDWRTKQPVIVRATAQWFADVSAIKDRALMALDSVDFIPASGKTRLSSFVGGRSQWCISRQRAWGVPIPALYHKDTGEVCITDDSVAHIISVLERRGTDPWFSDGEDDAAWLHHSLEPGKWVRGKDTMDVWFDSGTTWTSLEPRRDQSISDVYVEGTDQHRGWFQSSLLTHVAVQEAGSTPKAPYSTLITHGFTLDAEGRKMSKSLGNVISPDQIMDGSLLPPLKLKKLKGKKQEVAATNGESKPQYDSMGPDVLRLWVASSDYTRDVSIATQVLQDVQQSLQKYRVTFKFLLGVLSDYQSHAPGVQVNEGKRSFADDMILHQLSECSKAVHQAYKDYQFHKAVKDINALIITDLSAFYFEVCKDRMYAGSMTVRRQTQSVLLVILRGMLKMLGPIVPHLVEEVWEHMPASTKSKMEKGQQQDLHPLRQVWIPFSMSSLSHDNQAAERAVQDFRRLSAAVKLAQEEARRHGHLKSGLACKVQIHIPTATPSSLREHVLDWQRDGQLADALVVSQVGVEQESTDSDLEASAWRYEQIVDLEEGDVGTQCKVVVLPPEGEKCIRCWKYTAEEKEVPCERCRAVIEERMALP